LKAPLPLAVIGVGSLGYHHARIARELPHARLVGIHDTDHLRAGQVAEQLGTRAIGDLDELLQQVDAAIVAVPTSAHAEVALAALDRGVHLLIEKPIAPTLAEADRILAAAASQGLLVAIGHIERFNGAIRACAEFLDEPRFVESHRLAQFNPRGTDVAVVLDLMIHDIDLVLSLVNHDVVATDAVGVPVLTPNVDIANARLRFAGGAVANLTASRVSAERMRKIRIFQRSGYLSIDLARGAGEFYRVREDLDLERLAAGAGSLQEIVERIEIPGADGEPLRSELEAFVSAVHGNGNGVATGSDGRRALAVALNVQERIDESWS
jgi:predicted dehydrogenase